MSGSFPNIAATLSRSPGGRIAGSWPRSIAPPPARSLVNVAAPPMSSEACPAATVSLASARPLVRLRPLFNGCRPLSDGAPRARAPPGHRRLLRRWAAVRCVPIGTRGCTRGANGEEIVCLSKEWRPILAATIGLLLASACGEPLEQSAAGGKAETAQRTGIQLIRRGYFTGLYHRPTAPGQALLIYQPVGLTEAPDHIAGAWYLYDGSGHPVWLTFIGASGSRSYPLHLWGSDGNGGHSSQPVGTIGLYLTGGRQWPAGQPADCDELRVIFALVGTRSLGQQRQLRSARDLRRDRARPDRQADPPGRRLARAVTSESGHLSGRARRRGPRCLVHLR